MVCNCSFCGPGGGIYRWGGPTFGGTASWGKGTLADNSYKVVFGRPAHPVTGNVVGLPGGANRYNFATGMWCDDDNTRCEDYSENPG